MSDIDLFSDMTEDEIDEITEVEDDTEDETEESDDDAEVSDEDSRPTVSEIPEGAISVTDFAAYLTLLEGAPYGYVVPQAVYQAVRAKRDPLAHVLVKTEDDAQPRTYVMRDEAMVQWTERASRLETRGTGSAKPGSKRSPEALSDGFTKTDGALWKMLYADSRRAMWDEIFADRLKTVEKYHRWMAEAGISSDEITDLTATVKAAFAAVEQEKLDQREAKAQAAKAAAKAKKSNGNGSTPSE